MNEIFKWSISVSVQILECVGCALSPERWIPITRIKFSIDENWGRRYENHWNRLQCVFCHVNQTAVFSNLIQNGLSITCTIERKEGLKLYHMRKKFCGILVCLLGGCDFSTNKQALFVVCSRHACFVCFRVCCCWYCCQSSIWVVQGDWISSGRFEGGWIQSWPS